MLRRARLYIPKPTPKITEAFLRISSAEVIRTEFESINKEFVEYIKKKAKEGWQRITISSRTTTTLSCTSFTQRVR